MHLIVETSTEASDANGKPILLERSVLSALEKLAQDEQVSPAALIHRMVEQVLASDVLAASFLEYVHECWWGYRVTARSMHVFRVDSETASLLLDFSSTSGFGQKPDRIAALLVCYYSQIAKTAPAGTSALAVLASLSQVTNSQPQV